MKTRSIVILAVAGLLLVMGATSKNATKKVDDFSIGEYQVEVCFYDPVYRVPDKYPEFSKLPDTEKKKKSQIWDEYLHNSALYLFKVFNDKTDSVIYYCIRGNPEVTDSKMFYRVEVIQGINDKDFDPNKDDYQNKIKRTIDNVNCGGSLFENMTMFDTPKGKDAVGNGILFLGNFRRVQPYEEIKGSMISIIESDLGLADK